MERGPIERQSKYEKIIQFTVDYKKWYYIVL